MHKKHAATPDLCAALVATIFVVWQSQATHITGVVADSGRNAISGVKCVLAVSGLTDTTTGNGAFILSDKQWSTGRPAGGPTAGMLQIELHGNAIEVTVATAQPLTITVASLGGRILTSARLPSLRRRHVIALGSGAAGRPAEGVYAVAVSGKDFTKIFKLVTTGTKRNAAVTRVREEPTRERGMGRRVAAGADNDTLILSRTGYKTKKIFLDNLEQDLDTIILEGRSGNTYYVRTTGKDTNSGKSESPWRTIQHAVGKVAAGDWVLVGPGTYNESVSMTPATMANGASDNPIVFKAEFADKKPWVHSGLSTNKNQEWLVNGRQHVVVDGFEFRDSDTRGFIVYNDLGKTSHISILNCDFIRLTPKPGHIINFRNKAGLPSFIDYVTVENIYLLECDPADDQGSGNGVCEFQGARYVLFRNNRMEDCWNVGINWLGSNRPAGTNHCECGQPVYGVFRWNRVINQQAHQSASNPGPGNAFYADRGSGPVVWEGNYVTNIYNSGGFVANVEPEWDVRMDTFEHLIYRNNVVVGQHCFTGSGDGRSGKGHRDCAFYNNVFISDYDAGVRKCPVLLRVDQRDFDFKNNVFWRKSDNAAVSVSLAGTGEQTMRFQNNLWYHSKGESYARWNYQAATYTWGTWQASGRDTTGWFAQPKFASATEGDYRITASTPGFGDARPLTAATNSGTASTNLTVEDAKYFIDGYGIVPGDRIAINGNVVGIKAIDYGTKTLTLNAAATWSFGDGVQYAPDGAKVASIGVWSAVPN